MMTRKGASIELERIGNAIYFEEFLSNVVSLQVELVQFISYSRNENWKKVRIYFNLDNFLTK